MKTKLFFIFTDKNQHYAEFKGFKHPRNVVITPKPTVTTPGNPEVTLKRNPDMLKFRNAVNAPKPA